MTVAEQIQYAKISQYLSANDVAAGALWGARIDPRLPIILYMERKAVEELYNLENPINYVIPPAILINGTDDLLINSTDKLLI